MSSVPEARTPRGALAIGRVRRAIWPALAVTAAVLASWSILGHFFFADDFGDFFALANFGPRTFITTPAAGHMYVLRNSLTSLLFLVFRMEATPYHALALATHVANVVLLFAVAHRLTASAPLACFAAVLFAIAPTNGFTLGWHAASGHALAATFVLVALLLLVDEDDRRPVGIPRAVAITACGLAASQSFGTGTAVALVLPVVAMPLRPGLMHRWLPTLIVWSTPLLVALAARVLFTAPPGVNLGASNPRLIARLATDWAHIVPMLRHLASVGALTLGLGTLYPLDDYPGRLSAAVMVAAALAVVAALVLGTPRDRRRIAALLLVPAVSYGAIAAGRAAMIAAFNPGNQVSTIVRAGRYYYLGQAGLALLVAALIAQALRADRLVPAGRIVLAGWIACVVASRWLWPPSLEDYRQLRDGVGAWRERIAGAVRQAPPDGVACVPNGAFPLASGFPGALGVYILYNRDDQFEGRRVFFTSSDPKELALRVPDSRVGSLLLPTERCVQTR